jgi:GNAT superfamily N-acetyltransferase
MSRVTISDIRIRHDHSPESRYSAAGIWARATARRDKLLTPATVEEKLPGIERRLSADAGSLHLARLRSDAAGFLLVVARATVVEVVYLAVDPQAWGAGIARALLAYADDHARTLGLSHLELWVIDDNERAVRLYERSGWRRTEDLEVRSSAGRPERRLVKDLG